MNKVNIKHKICPCPLRLQVWEWRVFLHTSVWVTTRTSHGRQKEATLSALTTGRWGFGPHSHPGSFYFVSWPWEPQSPLMNLLCVGTQQRSYHEKAQFFLTASPQMWQWSLPFSFHSSEFVSWSHMEATGILKLNAKEEINKFCEYMAISPSHTSKW